MAIRHPYPFEELEGSPQEEYLEDDFRATMDVICAWETRRRLCHYFMVQFPYYERMWANGVFVRIRSIGVQPYTSETTEQKGLPSHAFYEKAKLTLQYTWKGPDNDNQQNPDQNENDNTNLWEESIEPQCEFLTLPYDQFSWDADKKEPLREEEAPGILLKTLDYRVTFYNVTSPPSGILSAVGCVNSNTISARRLGLSFAPETLLYQPPVMSQTVSTAGSQGWKIDYRFTYKPWGWNKFFKPTNEEGMVGKWKSLYYKGEQFKVYGTANLNQLFPRL